VFIILVTDQIFKISFLLDHKKVLLYLFELVGFPESDNRKNFTSNTVCFLLF